MATASWIARPDDLQSAENVTYLCGLCLAVSLRKKTAGRWSGLSFPYLYASLDTDHLREGEPAA